MQGVVKAFDPGSATGTVICDTDLAEYELADGALNGSLFRMLRQGQRVVFDLDASGFAVKIRLGSEIDMGTPGFGPPIIPS
jgi:cold shock CspA family protein